MTKVKCDTCNGTGEVIYSCCTGEIVSDDIALCPVCYENLGEEYCEDCKGTGKVEEGTELSDTISGVQSRAENYGDQKKGH